MKIEEEIEDSFEEGGKEENVYSETAREDLIEGDEISAEEEGFMHGYEEDMDLEREEENE